MVTLAITTYNRDHMTHGSFKWVRDDPRISEIVIVDDCSDVHIYESLQRMVAGFKKVKLYRNPRNLGCYHNKRKAVGLSTNEYVILLDSDNVLRTDYLDALPDSEMWTPTTLYAPSFAKPHFDYRVFSGKTIYNHNIKEFIGQKNFDCMINTCNFFVNRREYLKVFDSEKIEPWTADTLYFNYCWLKKGNYIEVLEGMEYDHLVHDGSHYKEHVSKTGNFAKEVMDKLRRL